MHVILIGETDSPHYERLAGVAVGYDEDDHLRVIVTVATLEPRERNEIADMLERQAAHLRAGQKHAPQ